jgi:hypothetical protein
MIIHNYTYHCSAWNPFQHLGLIIEAELRTTPEDALSLLDPFRGMENMSTRNCHEDGSSSVSKEGPHTDPRGPRRALALAQVAFPS